jgi:tRNA (cmo5U34)-methyltransferase
MSEPADAQQTTNHWQEEDSATFIDTAEIFVPGRAEQIATLVGLVPADADETFTIVELAAGDGTLAQTMLEAFPNCRYLALDGSEMMREKLRERLTPFGERVTVGHFDLAAQEWRDALPTPLRLVVSSLCVHHLTGAEKQTLFADMRARLETGGALLLADVIEPASRQVADLFARQYDDVVRLQSLQRLGDLSGHEEFQRAHWNYFLYDYGLPTDETIDHPSGLREQLAWMRDAGLIDVDCFWMQAGHAVYGGWKPQA